MKINIIEESIVSLETLKGNALNEFSRYIRAIEAATSIEKLKSILPDEVLRESSGEYHILVKDNYQHVAACIKININNKNEATLYFQTYD